MKKLIVLGILAIASIAHAQQIVVVPTYAPSRERHSNVQRIPSRPATIYGYGTGRSQLAYVRPVQYVVEPTRFVQVPAQVCVQPVAYSNYGYSNYSAYDDMIREQQLREQIVQQERYSRSMPTTPYYGNYSPYSYQQQPYYYGSTGYQAVRTVARVLDVLTTPCNNYYPPQPVYYAPRRYHR